MKDKLNTNLGNIIYIYNVLKKYSDEEHILSVKDIIKYVKEEFDEEIEDRIVRRNIRVLIEKLDIDIETFKENRQGYYLRTKDFEFSEIKMMIDLLHYSKFMEEAFSVEIAEKLKGLLSIYEKEIINETEKIEVYSKNIKTINKDVLNNIEVLSNFRLDRIKNIKSTEIPSVKTNQSIKEFVQSSVYMFGGERKVIELKSNNDKDIFFVENKEAIEMLSK
ncbi:MAG: WYL domain-containing protein [Clostridia bacterium]|nr:WYL domain-containing protein [Clostridia bacterium]